MAQTLIFSMLSGKAVHSDSVGGNLIDMMYTRGDYDVIVMLEAPDMDTLLSLKLAMMKTGAIAELNIHEEIDLGAMVMTAHGRANVSSLPPKPMVRLPNGMCMLDL